MFRFMNRFWAPRSAEALPGDQTGCCEALQPLLSAWMDDELTPAERRRVETHLESCAACRVDLSKMESCRMQLQCAGDVEIPAETQAAIRGALELEFALTQSEAARCGDIRPLLSPFLDAELTLSQRDAVASHISECRDCAAQLKTLRRTVRLVASLPPVAPPAGLGAMVLARTSQRPGRIPMVPAAVGALALAGVLFLILPTPTRQRAPLTSGDRVAEVATSRSPLLTKIAATAEAPARTVSAAHGAAAPEHPRSRPVEGVIQIGAGRVGARRTAAPIPIVRPVAPAPPIVVVSSVASPAPVTRRPPRMERVHRAPAAASASNPLSRDNRSEATPAPLPEDLIASAAANTTESSVGAMGSGISVPADRLHHAAPTMPRSPSASQQIEAPPPSMRPAPVITAMVAPASQAPGIWTGRSFTAADQAQKLPGADQDQQNAAAVTSMNRTAKFILEQTRGLVMHPGSAFGQSINGDTYIKLANGHGGVKW